MKEKNRLCVLGLAYPIGNYPKYFVSYSYTESQKFVKLLRKRTFFYTAAYKECYIKLVIDISVSFSCSEYFTISRSNIELRPILRVCLAINRSGYGVQDS